MICIMIFTKFPCVSSDACLKECYETLISFMTFLRLNWFCILWFNLKFVVCLFSSKIIIIYFFRTYWPTFYLKLVSYTYTIECIIYMHSMILIIVVSIISQYLFYTIYIIVYVSCHQFLVRNFSNSNLTSSFSKETYLLFTVL